MPSIYDYLLGGMGDEADYYAEDPWYRAGASILKSQMPAPETSAQAFLFPFLQGAVGGGLIGYGKDSANESAYSDYRKSPFLQGSDLYSSEEMPKDWSIKQGQRNSIETYLADQQKNEKELQDLKAESQMAQILAKEGVIKGPDGGVVPIPGLSDIKAENARKVAAAKEKMKGPLSGIPAATQAQLAKSKSVVDEARVVADDLAQITGWTELQSTKMFSGADQEGVGIALANLADKLARARTGAAMNKEETKLYSKIIGGDLSAGPQQVAKLLKKLADAESRMSKSEMGFFENPTFDNPQIKNAIPSDAIPIPGKTSGGKQVYNRGGRLWVPD